MSSIKISVFGLAAVGKSCLSLRFIRDIFLEEYEPTISDNYQKTITIDNKTYQVDIFDTAGMENISALQASTIKQRDCFILVYSIVDRASFDHIERVYDDILRVKEVEKVPCVLCGNKVDLEKHREISKEEGVELAQKIHAVFLETSAKSGLNVELAVKSAVNEVLKSRPVDVIPEAPKKKSICHLF